MVHGPDVAREARARVVGAVGDHDRGGALGDVSPNLGPALDVQDEWERTAFVPEDGAHHSLASLGSPHEQKSLGFTNISS